MVDELGDVLLQVAFHAVIAEQEQSFVYQDIETAIVEKLIRRHPHVFADSNVTDADEVVKNWQDIKAAENKMARDKAEEVPKSMASLMRAAKLTKKLEWPISSKDDILKLVSDIDSEKVDAAQIGELLTAVASFAKAHEINAELALRDSLSERIRQTQ